MFQTKWGWGLILIECTNASLVETPVLVVESILGEPIAGRNRKCISSEFS